MVSTWTFFISFFFSLLFFLPFPSSYFFFSAFFEERARRMAGLFFLFLLDYVVSLCCRLASRRKLCLAVFGQRVRSSPFFFFPLERKRRQETSPFFFFGRLSHFFSQKKEVEKSKNVVTFAQIWARRISLFFLLFFSSLDDNRQSRVFLSCSVFFPSFEQKESPVADTMVSLFLLFFSLSGKIYSGHPTPLSPWSKAGTFHRDRIDSHRGLLSLFLVEGHSERGKLPFFSFPPPPFSCSYMRQTADFWFLLFLQRNQ